MRFDIPCVKNFLKENGFVFTVRGFDMKDSFVEVEGIGKCWRKKIKQVKTKFEVWDYQIFSGFNKETMHTNLRDELVDFWWEVIEKFCKGKPKWLCLVVKVE